MISMGLSLLAATLPAMSGGAVYGAKWGSKAYRTTEAVGAVGKIASNADVITRGAAKYGDEVVEAVTGIAKYGDEVAGIATGVARHGDEVAVTLNGVAKHGDDLLLEIDLGFFGKVTEDLGDDISLLRYGGNNTTVTVKTKKEADALLKEAFPDYQKVKGVGSQEPSGIRKKQKLDRFKKGGAYHKDYTMEKISDDAFRVKGHGANNIHGKYPHINIKRRDGKKVLINIIG